MESELILTDDQKGDWVAAQNRSPTANPIKGAVEEDRRTKVHPLASHGYAAGVRRVSPTR
jgi:hypothetical protein